MHRSHLSLRGLEVFQQIAKSGSVQKVAEDTGLSISTVSHHLRSLENALGVSLVDHGRRPMVLTPAGAIFARHVEDGLRMIRRGETELTSGNLAEVSQLRFGLVDDLDGDVAMGLARFLAAAMPKCRFRHHSRSSHEILRLLYEDKIDVGIATQPLHDVAGLIEFPMLRDPFVVALPANSDLSAEAVLSGEGSLPLLRYSSDQIIGNLVEAQLRRLQISLPNRFELESNSALVGMIADGGGWAITTPLSCARVRRLQSQIALHPFPNKGFSRTLSLFTTDVYAPAIVDLIASATRRMIRQQVIDPSVAFFPWLEGMFTLLTKPSLATPSTARQA